MGIFPFSDNIGTQAAVKMKQPLAFRAQKSRHPVVNAQIAVGVITVLLVVVLLIKALTAAPPI